MKNKFIVCTTADQCQFNHECLNCNGHEFCNVTHVIDNELIFVEKTDKICNYMLNFGNEIICKCPVRKEIYFKYNV